MVKRPGPEIGLLFNYIDKQGYQDRTVGPTSNVGVSNVGVFKRRSHQTQESQTSECSNAGVGQTSECSNVGVIIA